MNHHTHLRFLLALGLVMTAIGCSGETLQIGTPGIDDPDDNNPDIPDVPDKNDPDVPDKNDPDVPDKNDPDVPDNPDQDKCKDRCQIDDRKCDENGILICKTDDDGCTDWIHETICTSGTHCDDSTLTCIPGCAETCPQTTKRCNDDIIESCLPDENGCALWEQLEECETECNPETVECIQSCTSICDEGAKMCSSNGITTCADLNNDGCFEWGPEQPCPNDQRCDEISVSCTNGCQSECKNGEIKAFAASAKTCKDANGDGCFEWVDDITCKPGEKFDATTQTCVLACGDDCDPFSIVFIPDPQLHTRSYTVNGEKDAPVLKKETEWISNNRTARNIKAVITLGDITDTNHSESYEFNTKYFNKLPKDLPFVLAGGNHDYLNGNCNHGGSSKCPYSKLRSDGYTFARNASQFADFINESTITDRTWEHGFYGTNTYAKFTAANTEFLVIALEFAPRKASICWAEELIKANPNAKVILETHAYLTNTAHQSTRSNGVYTKGRSDHPINNAKYNVSFYNAGSGIAVFNELASRYNNVIMVAGGHTEGSVFRIGKGKAGNWISELLVDYQAEDTAVGTCKGDFSAESKYGSGGGWMRILTFDPKNLTIASESVSVLGAKKFYCSVYPSSPTSMPSYTLDPNSDDKAATNKHKFLANFDFITPVDFKESKNNNGYLLRTANQISSGNQITPAIAMKRDSGDHVIVWADDAYNNDTKEKIDTDGANNHDIRARILCPSGCELVKNQITVNTTTKGNQIDPDVAMDAQGNFTVVWTNADDNTIAMRKFDLTGAQKHPETKINSTGPAALPAVAMDDTGNTVVVTWQSGNDIVMRGFDNNGNEIFPQTNVSTKSLSANGKRLNPDIAMDKDGNFAITWQDDSNGDGNFEIAARGFNRNASERIPEFTANKDKTGQQKNPAIGMNRDGIFHIAWEDDTDGNGTFRIRMSAWNSDGSVNIEDQLAASSQAAANPSVCVAADGTGYFAWDAKKFNDGTTKHEYVVLRASSKAFATQSLAHIKTTGTQDQPDIACTDAGKTAITWRDDVDANGAYEVLSRGFN